MKNNSKKALINEPDYFIVNDDMMSKVQDMGYNKKIITAEALRYSIFIR